MMKARVIESALLATALMIPAVSQAQEVAAGMNDGVLENEAQVLEENSKEVVNALEDAEESSKGEGKSSKEDDDKSWGVNATVGFDLGLGAFVKDEHARKVRSRFTMAVGGYYTIPVIDTDVFLETGFSQWMSKAGGSNGQYEFRWSDTALGFSRDIWSYKSGDFSVAFDASLSFVLPTSKASINSSLYTSIVPSLGASIKFWRISLEYGIVYSYNAHKYTSVTMDPNEIDVLSRSTGNEIIDSHNIAIGGVLAEHDLANNFVISIDCIKKILALSIGFGFSDSWTYDNGTITSDDEYVGEHAKVGRGHSQYSQGSLVLSYTPVKYATVSFGMISTQPWKTADNKTIRFPWFDTVSPSKNYTKFLLSAAFQY